MKGEVENVPADGLTTRQRRNRPLLIVHTGDGKGKSTAAFGLALRGWNQGWPIGVFQFVKSAKWRIGEQTALETLAEVHATTGAGGPIEWHKMGSGWSWSRKTGTDDDHAAAASEGWAEIKRRLAAETHTLYVLDEFTYPIAWGWIDVDDVVATLAERPGRQHVIITGRRADPKIIEIADLVTEMTKIEAPVRPRTEGSTGHRMVTTPPPTTGHLPTGHRLPRLVIAAPASGHGKTTVATGLLAALRADGLEPAGFKIGPDFIDPGYHALATGRPGRNLDPFLCGEDQLVPLLLHGSEVPTPADVAVVEGVMGLFDGRMGGDGWASTAHVARVIAAPVVLVLDISQVSRTAAAWVHGLHTFDPDTRISGVIVNKAGSVRHSDEVVAALEATGIPVLGVLPRDAGIEAPSRHLGLVPVAERPEASAALDRLAGQIAEHVDLTQVLSIAYSAPPLIGTAWDPSRLPGFGAERTASGDRPVVAVAGGRAFTFRYAETTELLTAAGLQPVIFDPVTDDSLPAGTAGIYLGGGFPEVHAPELAGNASMITSIRQAIAAGVPTVAECAGLLYLCRSVDGVPMVGAIDAEAAMSPRLTLGYRTAVADHDHLLGATGRRVTGHEFHRTTVTPSAGELPGWLLEGVADGFSLDPAGTGTPTLHASYLHTHWAGHPTLAARFADAVHAYASARAGPTSGAAARTVAWRRHKSRRGWTTGTRIWTTTGTPTWPTGWSTSLSTYGSRPRRSGSPG